jgi:hypothetical protein
MLRSALFVVVLLFAQVAALTHAVEHLRADEAGHSAHSLCVQCLAAQGMDSSLVAAPLPAPQSSAEQALAQSPLYYSVERFLVFRQARAPPLS